MILFFLFVAAEQKMTNSSHKPSFVTLVIANVVLLVIVFALNGLSTSLCK
jgi:hypothetical protein